jgi:hypothetical protein
MTTQHNARIGLVDLDPSETVGEAVNWYLTHDPVPCDALRGAFAAQGLDPSELPDQTTGKARLRRLVVYDNPRLYRRTASGARREYVAAQVKHSGDDQRFTSYSYSANLGGGRERSRLVHVGTITHDSSLSSFSWRFAPDSMRSGESLDAYVTRCVSMLDETGVGADDLAFFASFAHRTLSEVDVYESAPHYDVVTLRDALRPMFLRAGAFPLSARGGFWFAPRLDCEDGGPSGRCRRIMAAYESVDPRNRFFLLTMPRDERTLETAATVVHDGLMGRVSAVLDALSKVDEIKRASQHETRLLELADVVETAELYREMLGMTTDELEARISEARQVIDDQVSAYRAEVEARKQAGKATKPEPDQQPSQADLSVVSRRSIFGLTDAVRNGGAVYLSDGVEVVLDVRKDAALGYTYTISADGIDLASGSATTQRATVDAIRSIR